MTDDEAVAVDTDDEVYVGVLTRSAVTTFKVFSSIIFFSEWTF